MNGQRKSLNRALFGLITFIAISLGGYGFAGPVNSVTNANGTSQKSANTLPMKDVQRFATAISLIKSYYVQNVSDDKLFANAIQGMMEGLDPHSGYLDASDFRDLTSTTEGQFGGIGIEVTLEEGVLKVVTPIDDTPAANAGIKPGDYIVELDDVPVQGMPLKDAIGKMRGKKGTILNLVVIRKGEKEPLSFNIVRDVIHVQSVKAKMLENGYGYIRLSEFDKPTAGELSVAITSLNQQANGQLKGLVLDLRNNPGGLLDTAIEVADIFLDSNTLGNNKLIVYTKGRVPGAHFVANSTPGDLLNGAPMVVLINGGSASAAEILAGALQDHRRAILVGENSFGKGSVQTVLPLDDTTGIKMTTALYYTPLDRSIQARGIKPDVLISSLQVQKPKNGGVGEISELNLIGHFPNADTSSSNNTGTQNQETKNLAYTDYQLYEALNILKGVVMAKKLQ